MLYSMDLHQRAMNHVRWVDYLGACCHSVDRILIPLNVHVRTGWYWNRTT